MSINTAQMVRKRNKAEVYGVQHEFDGHEHCNHAFAVNETGHAQRKKDGAQNQIPGQRYGRKVHYSISFCAKTTAPKMAIRIRTEITSNGSRYSVKSICPIFSAVPPTQLPNSTALIAGRTLRIKNPSKATNASNKGMPAICANQDLLLD